MLKYSYIKSDYKQIFRDPMMLVLYLVPILILVFSKLGLIFLPKYIGQYFNLNIFVYQDEILSSTLSLVFLLVGTAVGFMMIDDKDGKIYELMQVTPLGRKGYLFNRLFLPVVITFMYSMIGWALLHLKSNIWLGLLVSLLISSETVLIGITLFHIAKDKVKGLTYAKALSCYVLIALVDLLKIKALTLLAHLFPVYWVTKLIKNTSFFTVALAMGVHLVWVSGFIIFFRKSKA